MKLKTEDYPFILLTPAMIGGAAGKAGEAEVRVASIRGQIRWWHREAGLSPFCNEVWGQTDKSIIASRVGLSLVPGLPPQHESANILPHDLKKSGRPRDAIAAGQRFTLRLTRLVGCSQAHWLTARNAVKLWLFLGGVGLRVNRAAGSVWPLDIPGQEAWVPADETALKKCVSDLGYWHDVQLADPSVLTHSFLRHESTEAAKLRHAASDTVSVPRYFGGIKPRQPSPLKMKVIRLGEQHRLLLTGLATSEMSAARGSLGAGKPLGSVAWL